MNYKLTDYDIVLNLGGHAKPGHGRQKHYPIFIDDDGIEYISLNGLSLTPLSIVKQNEHTRREMRSKE